MIKLKQQQNALRLIALATCATLVCWVHTGVARAQDAALPVAPPENQTAASSSPPRTDNTTAGSWASNKPEGTSASGGATVALEASANNPSAHAAKHPHLFPPPTAHATVYFPPKPPPVPAAPAGDKPPSAPPSDAPVVGASINDGFKVEAADKSYSLAMKLLAQLRYEAALNGSKVEKSQFRLFMIRPQFRVGFWGQKVDVFVQPEYSNENFALLDAELNVLPSEEVRFKFGQFITPDSRSFMTPVPLLLFPDFSQVNKEFRAGRDIGGTVYGVPFKGKLEYYAGVFNGAGITQPQNDNRKLMYVGRLAYNPWGFLTYDETLGAHPERARASFAVNGYHNARTPSTTVADLTTGNLVTKKGDDVTTKNLSLDATWAAGHWLGSAEAYMRWQDSGGQQDHSHGAFAYAGYHFTPRWEAATRLNYMHRANQQNVYAAEALLVFYAYGNHFKTQLYYSVTGDDQFAKLQQQAMIQLQMW